MADKNFKVKKNIQVTDLAVAGPVTVDSSGILASSSALAVNLGGTGQTTASAAFDALVPSQTNNANKLLGTDGTSVSWVSPGIAYQTSAPDNPVTGQLWVDSDETGDSLDPYIIRRKTITATAGQTVFTTDVVFTDGYEQIYYNGVLLVRATDYTTSGSTNTVTLLQGASAGDTVEIISSTPINLVNTITSSGGTITAPNASTVPLTIQGTSSQSANLLNIKNNAGEIRHEFSPNGVAIFRGTQADGSLIRIERYSDDLAVLALRSYGGTISSPTTKTTASRLGMITAEGYDGINPLNPARITFWVDGSVTTGSIPGAIAFSTSPAGGTHTERMRITSAGNVYIGTTDASAYGGKLAIANSGQASMFMWNVGQGSGHIGFAASGSTMRIVNTYTDGLIANGKGIDIDSNGNVGIKLNTQSPATLSGDMALEVNTNGAMGTAWFKNFAGTRAAPTEVADWPWPTVAITTASNFYLATVLRFSLPNDNLWQTDDSTWNFKLNGTTASGWDSNSNLAIKSVSDADLGLQLLGPGNLRLGTQGARWVILRTSGSDKAWLTPQGNFGVGWNPDTNWKLSVNDAGTSGAGAFLSTTSSASIHAGLFEAANTSYTGVILRTQTFRSNTSAFRFFDAFSSSNSSADLEFNLRGDGQAYADGSWNAGGADYAEYFEWLDENPDNEDRRGYSVSLVNDKIKICEEGDVPVGVISGNPSVVGDSGWNKWNGKYLVDRFGSYVRDENEERVLNPEYDPETEYVSREDRPEWAIVGLMGKLRLRKGQVTGAGWIKMKDIDEDTEEWLVK
jgi:hypothetical protein